VTPPQIDEVRRIVRVTGQDAVSARPPGMNAPAIELRRLKAGWNPAIRLYSR
jgi:hypothetical protein